jgi:thiamine biosynthesis lipoprotein ApbE
MSADSVLCIPSTRKQVNQLISNLLSVSIIANNATFADALATACMVSGLARAKAMVERFPNTEGYFIVGNKYGEFEVQTTSNWSQYELN